MEKASCKVLDKDDEQKFGLWLFLKMDIELNMSYTFLFIIYVN